MTTAPSTGRSTESTTCQLLNDTEMADVLLEHRTTATRAVRSVLGISRDEEDLVQETLTRLVIRLRQPGEISVGAWTWRVAHNVAVDHARTRRAIPTDIAALDRGVGEGLDSQLVGSELATAISHGLAKLPDRQRAALMAQAALDGGRGGHAIVAANLGVTAKAAESILARARRSLRRELSRMGVREGIWVAAGVVAFGGLRRLARSTAALGGALTIAAVSVVASAAYVFHVPVLSHSSTTSQSPVHGSVSPSKSFGSPTLTLTPTSPTTRALVAKTSTVAAVPPALELSPSILPRPSVLTRPGLNLPTVTVPGSLTPTLPGALVPAVTLRRIIVPSPGHVTSPTATVPPSLTTVRAPTVAVLPPLLPGVIP
jgi:RNA polymerase sigma factor (sigma-70 family)